MELNTIKNAINGNHGDLADFKRQGAERASDVFVLTDAKAIQQHMQSEINECGSKPKL